MSANQLGGSAVTSSAINVTQRPQTFENYQSTSAGSSSDAHQFSQSLARYKEQAVAPAASVASADNSNSLGSRVMNNVAEVSSRLKQEHTRISAMVEKAVASKDSFLMMGAMQAMSTYDQHAQMATKTVAKAATGLETLTRLQ